MAVIRSNMARTTTAKMIFCVKQYPHSSIRSTTCFQQYSTEDLKGSVTHKMCQ